MDTEKFKKIVWKYYAEHGRKNLPWRKTKDPYKIFGFGNDAATDASLAGNSEIQRLDEEISEPAGARQSERPRSP